MKIVFMGSSKFGIPALKGLLQAHSVVGVVSTPARPQSRGLKLVESPIAGFAKQERAGPLFTPDDLQDPAFYEALVRCNADIFVVVAFRLLPKSLFSLPSLGTLNIHASLLPKYRGPAPIQRAIEAGERETGVTLFRIDEGVDTGLVLLQKQTPIGLSETSIDLSLRLSELGAGALVETLEGLAAGTLQPIIQDASQASRAPKLAKEEAAIDWRLPAENIYNKVRAFKPFPGTFALLAGKRFGIETAEPVATSQRHEPGTIIRVAASFFEVQCSKGSLRILEVKPEGRTRMSVHDFLLGHRLQEGERL